MKNLAGCFDLRVEKNSVGIFLGIGEDNGLLMHAAIAENDIFYDV